MLKVGGCRSEQGLKLADVLMPKRYGTDIIFSDQRSQR